MTRDEKVKRIKDALTEMYNRAESAFPRTFGWDEINSIMQKVDNYKKKQFPYMAFYLAEKDQDKIKKEACKYTRYSWRWPRRTQIDEETGKIVPDPEWDEHYAERQLKWKALSEKKITQKEYNQWMNEQAEKYHMIHRNYDAEDIRFNIDNYAPSINKNGVDELRTLFEKSFDSYAHARMYMDVITEVNFCTLSDLPKITDADVEAKIAENKALIEKYEAADLDFAKKMLDPNEVRISLEDARVRHCDYLNRIILLMCDFWYAVDQK